MGVSWWFINAAPPIFLYYHTTFFYHKGAALERWWPPPITLRNTKHLITGFHWFIRAGAGVKSDFFNASPRASIGRCNVGNPRSGNSNKSQVAGRNNSESLLGETTKARAIKRLTWKALPVINSRLFVGCNVGCRSPPRSLTCGFPHTQVSDGRGSSDSLVFYRGNKADNMLEAGKNRVGNCRHCGTIWRWSFLRRCCHASATGESQALSVRF